MKFPSSLKLAGRPLKWDLAEGAVGGLGVVLVVLLEQWMHGHGFATDRIAWACLATGFIYGLGLEAFFFWLWRRRGQSY